MSMSVLYPHVRACLSASISSELHVQSSPISHDIFIVALSSSCGVAIRYVFSVLRMTSCFLIASYWLRRVLDDDSRRRPAQIPQLDTPQASKESHNSIHNL